MGGRADLPIACQLKALDGRERARQKELLGVVQRKIRRVVDLAGGFELELPADPGTFAEVEEWVGLERRCCAFAEIEVEHRPGERLAVRVTGGPGAREVLAAEMGLPGFGARNITPG